MAKWQASKGDVSPRKEIVPDVSEWEPTMSLDPCFYCGEYFEAVLSIVSVCKDCENKYCEKCEAMECEHQ